MMETESETMKDKKLEENKLIYSHKERMRQIQARLGVRHKERKMEGERGGR